MDCKLVLISGLVLFCVVVDSFSYNRDNGNQAQWSASQQTNPNVYQTGYESYPKETIQQNGYNSQLSQGYNVVQNSPVLPSSSMNKNLAAGLWNNERANQPLQIVGKPYQSQDHAYPYNSVTQSYSKNYQPYQSSLNKTLSGYESYISQDMQPSNTNQYNPTISSGDYVPLPKPNAPSSQDNNTPAKYSTKSIPVDQVPVTSINLEDGSVYKDQDMIVPTQSTVFEQPIYDKPYIIVHENGTYEKLDNLDNIVWDEHNRAHLKTKEPPNVLIAIIEIEGVKNPEKNTALEVPYDTGNTKTSQDRNDFSVPQNYTNPIVQTTTDPQKYFKTEYLMPISSPYSFQPEPQLNEEHVKNNKDSLSINNPYSYDNIINMYSNTVFSPEANNYAADIPNKNVNYNLLNNNTPGTIASSLSYGVSKPQTPNIESYKPYPFSTYPAKTDTYTNTATDRTPDIRTYQPYVNYNTHNFSYAMTDSKLNTATDKPQQTNIDRVPNESHNTLSIANTLNVGNNPHTPTYGGSELYVPNIENYKQYSNSTDSKTYTDTENTLNFESYKPYVGYMKYSSPNAVSDKPKPNTITEGPQLANTDRIPYTTDKAPSTVNYSPLYKATDRITSTTSNTPYSDTEGPADGINYNPYYDSATDSSIENNTFIYQTTTANYDTYSYTPSTDKYKNTKIIGNDLTKAAPTDTPKTTSEPDVAQPISETDDQFEQYDQQQVDKEEPNTNNQEYHTNALSNPNSDLLTSGTPYMKTVPRNGYYRPRYFPKPNIMSYEDGTKRPLNPSSNNPHRDFYSRPSYYRPGQNTYNLKEPSNSAFDISTNTYELQNKHQTSYDNQNPAYYGSNPDKNDDYYDLGNSNPPSDDTNDTDPQDDSNQPSDDSNDSDPQDNSNQPSDETNDTGRQDDSKQPPDDTNDVSDPQDKPNPVPDVTNYETVAQNGNNGSKPEDYDYHLNTNNKNNNLNDDDEVSGTTSRPQSSNASNNGKVSQNVDDKQPAYDGYSNTNDDMGDTSNPEADVSDRGVAPQDENETPIDYALHLREPPRLGSDLEIDPSQLKKNVDKPVVWFRKDDSFWDKVTKGEGAYDSLSVYNINCKPMLIERMTTVHHFANGTKIVEYVDSIWDSPDDPHPREVTAKQVFQVDSD